MAPATQSQVKVFLSMLRQLKKDAKLQTAADLGELIGIDARTVRTWLSGTSKPSVESIAKTNVLLRESQEFYDTTLRALNNAVTVGECK